MAANKETSVDAAQTGWHFHIKRKTKNSTEKDIFMLLPKVIDKDLGKELSLEIGFIWTLDFGLYVLKQ